MEGSHCGGFKRKINNKLKDQGKKYGAMEKDCTAMGLNGLLKLIFIYIFLYEF